MNTDNYFFRVPATRGIQGSIKAVVINLFYGDNLDKFFSVKKINKDDLSGN
ncbi:hypothetical protein [Enterobacter asburiae]|uniref:hypothetical protein n=1 Tax=Enterobacter asburiae TaxID=61645 RepID=UPI001D0F5F35|nr:hypothetical protein [Enterobacter asburiae]MCC2911945.1 hypothetical protein [Enterobacter asburiae]